MLWNAWCISYLYWVTMLHAREEGRNDHGHGPAYGAVYTVCFVPCFWAHLRIEDPAWRQLASGLSSLDPGMVKSMTEL